MFFFLEQLKVVQVNFCVIFDGKFVKVVYLKFLIFEFQVVVGQIYVDIYRVVCEGFDELCMIDS